VKPYPLLFAPILKEKVWGGRRLADLGKELPPDVLIGESWEVADLPREIPGGRSTIVNGELAGRTLGDAIASAPKAILGAARPTPAGGFPLLVKFLDAAENLSVQVHPDEAYARRHPGAHVKSEAWVVVRADPGAVIYKGLAPHVTREVLARHVEDGRVVDDLVRFEAAPGQCHYLPSGTCHALGAGIVVAEIQTPSDTTFRLWDWGRLGRELHVAEALECVRYGDAPQGAAVPGVPTDVGGVRATPLLRAPHFGLERIEARSEASLRIVTNDLPEVWMVLRGRAAIRSPGAPDADLPAGTTTLLPAALEDAEAGFRRGCEVLRITLPSPLAGLIA
jgi:mannose-6-phosphate isomerase